MSGAVGSKPSLTRSRLPDCSRVFRSSCEYSVETEALDAAWWSLAVFDESGNLIRNSAERYAFKRWLVITKYLGALLHRLYQPHQDIDEFDELDANGNRKEFDDNGDPISTWSEFCWKEFALCSFLRCCGSSREVEDESTNGIFCPMIGTIFLSVETTEDDEATWEPTRPWNYANWDMVNVNVKADKLRPHSHRCKLEQSQFDTLSKHSTSYRVQRTTDLALLTRRQGHQDGEDNAANTDAGAGAFAPPSPPPREAVV